MSNTNKQKKYEDSMCVDARGMLVFAFLAGVVIVAVGAIERMGLYNSRQLVNGRLVPYDWMWWGAMVLAVASVVVGVWLKRGAGATKKKERKVAVRLARGIAYLNAVGRAVIYGVVAVIFSVIFAIAREPLMGMILSPLVAGSVALAMRAVYDAGVVRVMAKLDAIHIHRGALEECLDKCRAFEDAKDNLSFYRAFFKNVYMIGFVVFWFGYLAFFDYVTIRDMLHGEELTDLVGLANSLLFWVAGILLMVLMCSSRRLKLDVKI